jgi:hypothetical protein
VLSDALKSTGREAAIHLMMSLPEYQVS